jgi:hypothetical protein
MSEPRHVRYQETFCVVAKPRCDFRTPLVGLKKPGIERSRDRVLTDEELNSFWRAAEGLG